MFFISFNSKYRESTHVLTHTKIKTHTHTHAYRRLVFFLIFEPAHSVPLLSDIIIIITTIDQPFEAAVCKAFPCTHIDGQRGGVWCLFKHVLLLLLFSSISDHDDIHLDIFPNSSSSNVSLIFFIIILPLFSLNDTLIFQRAP